MNKELNRMRMVYGVSIVVLAIVTSFLVLHTLGLGTVSAAGQ